MIDRRARIETAVSAPAAVAAAIMPDNTPEMTTRVADGVVRTDIGRDSTGGLQSTVDDYLVNLAVADRLCRSAPDLAATTEARRPSHTDTDQS